MLFSVIFSARTCKGSFSLQKEIPNTAKGINIVANIRVITLNHGDRRVRRRQRTERTGVEQCHFTASAFSMLRCACDTEVENLDYSPDKDTSLTNTGGSFPEDPAGSDITIWLSESLHIRKSQVIWAARHEMAQSLEDVLARRTRALFLDARESMKIAPESAKMLAAELGRDQSWVKVQIEQYQELAMKYLV